MALIEVTNVSKSFQRHSERSLLRHKVIEFFRRSRPEDEQFYALRGVSFQVDQGESVALVGSNGAGKSTMLSLVCGLTEPTSGKIAVKGRIAPLLELGSGFHPDLTGRENVFVNGALLGFSEKQMRESFDEIVEFSGIADFIDEATRTYSSGMLVRLAFSVAVHVSPAILIVDEVLAVGDSQFQEKCFQKVAELRRNHTAMLCVSHSPKMVTDFCDRAIWLHHGEMVMDGTAEEVIKAYTAFTVNPQAGLPRRESVSISGA